MNLSQIHESMQDLHRFAKHEVAISSYWDAAVAADAFKNKWEDMFGIPISLKNAEYFTQNYRNMYGKKTRQQQRQQQHGGNSPVGAPLTYTMTPGANVAVYGRFPTEIATDPASIRDLDVFYNSGISRGCGIENSSRSIPIEMGSNKVGGSRRRNKTYGGKRSKRSSSKKTYRQKKHRGGGKSHRNNRRMRGGVLGFDTVKDMGTSLTQFRPFLSSAPPNYGQMALHAYSGNPAALPAPADPTAQNWAWASRGSQGAINPGNITPIMKSMDQMARPTPWQT